MVIPALESRGPKPPKSPTLGQASGLTQDTGPRNPLFLESRPLNVATGKGDLCQWGLTGTRLAITIYDSSPLFFTETYSASNTSSSGDSLSPAGR